MRMDLGYHWNDLEFSHLFDSAYDGIELLEHKRKARNVRATNIREAGLVLDNQGKARRWYGGLAAEFMPDESGELTIMVVATDQPFPADDDDSQIGLPMPLAEVVIDGVLVVPELVDLGAGVLVFDRARYHPQDSSPVVFQWLAGALVRLLTVDVEMIPEEQIARLLQVNHPGVKYEEKDDSEPELEEGEEEIISKDDVQLAIDWMRHEEARAAVDVANLIEELGAREQADWDDEENPRKESHPTIQLDMESERKPISKADIVAALESSGGVPPALATLLESYEDNDEVTSVPPPRQPPPAAEPEDQTMQIDVHQLQHSVQQSGEPPPEEESETSAPAASGGDAEDLAEDTYREAEGEGQQAALEEPQPEPAHPEEPEPAPVAMVEDPEPEPLDIQAIDDDVDQPVQPVTGEERSGDAETEAQALPSAQVEAFESGDIQELYYDEYDLYAVDEIVEDDEDHGISVEEWVKEEFSEDAGAETEDIAAQIADEAPEEEPQAAPVARLPEQDAEVIEHWVDEEFVEDTPEFTGERQALAAPETVEDMTDASPPELERWDDAAGEDAPTHAEPPVTHQFDIETVDEVLERLGLRDRVISQGQSGAHLARPEGEGVPTPADVPYRRRTAEEWRAVTLVKSSGDDGERKDGTGQFRHSEIQQQMDDSESQALEVQPLSSDEVTEVMAAVEKSPEAGDEQSVDDSQSGAFESPAEPTVATSGEHENIEQQAPPTMNIESNSEPPLTRQMVQDLQQIAADIERVEDESGVGRSRGGQPDAAAQDPFGYPPPQSSKRTPFGDLVFYQCANCGEFGAMKVALHTYRCYRCEAMIEYQPTAG